MKPSGGWRSGRLDKPSPETPSTQNAQQRKKDVSASIMSHMFCKGSVSEEAESIVSLESGSVFPPSHATSRKTRHSDRVPLQATTLENQNSILSTVRTPPYSGSACFTDAVTSLLPSLGPDSVTCGGACLDGTSKSMMMMSSLVSPRRDVNANPVIEALGVTPKSKNRPNKYSVSSAMNPTGSDIPTPAQPRRKQFAPVFGSLPESVSLASLKEGPADEDAFLPDDFNPNDDKKEVSILYTEADVSARIQEALVSKENELATKFASASEDSATLKDWETQMQAQLEEQGTRWNKDLQERLEEQGTRWNKDLQERLAAARSHHKKKQSSYKARIADLEQQCQVLQTSEQDGRLEQERKAEQQDLELKNILEASSAERTKLLKEITEQNEKLAKLDEETSKISQQSNNCTPGFIREMQNKISALQNERATWQSRESNLRERVRDLEENTSHLESVESGLREGRKMEEQKTTGLQDQVTALDKDNSSLLDTISQLQEKLTTRDADITTMESKLSKSTPQEEAMGQALEEKTQQYNTMKAGFQQCIDGLSQKMTTAQPNNEEPTEDVTVATASDEVDWMDSASARLGRQVDTLCNLVSDAEQRARKAQELVEQEGSARTASESEVARLSDLLQSVQAVNERAVPELEAMQTQLGKAETQLSELSESMTKKEQENAWMMRELETSQNEAVALEKKVRELQDANRKIANAEAVELREKIQDLETQQAEKTKEEESQLEELRFMLELKQKSEDLSTQLRLRDEEFTALEQQKEELKHQVAELRQKLEALQQVVEEKDTVLGSFDENASQIDIEKGLVTKKIDEIVDHIQKMEIQYKVEHDQSTMDAESRDSNDVCENDIRKLEKVEHHLLHTVDEFVRGKVAEAEQKIDSHKEESTETIHTLERDLEEKRQLITASASEIDCLEKKISSAQEDVSNAEKKQQETLQDLSSVREQLELLESEKASLTQSISTLETEIEKSNGKNELEIAAATEEKQKVLDKATLECERLQKEVEDCNGKELTLEKRLNELESLLETSRADCKRLDSLVEIRSGNVEEELLKRTAELETKSKETVERCEAQVREVRESHGKEIDEMLAQLDLVVEEQKESDEQNERIVKEKDAIVAALGAQLAESQKRIISVNESLEENTRIMEHTEEGAIKAKIDAESCKSELAKMKDTHSKALESEKHRRENGIEAVREETIQEAEQQFKKANDVYRKLVQDYKKEQSKVAELSSSLEVVKREMEKVKKEHASKIANLNSDLAELKASQAKADAAAARTVKDHLDDLEKLKAIEKDLRSRLSQSELTNRSTQKLLATIVAEKEQLLSENEELKLVCEEAMSLAEHSSSS